jgi:putative ATP-dependent endonuclease of OLD family
MKLRRIKLENVRSFLEPAELLIDGDISIIIGPNGGGKTNLLDATVTTIRRHLLTSWVSRPSATLDDPERYEFVVNDQFNSARLERHSQAPHLPQTIEVELEVTAQDLTNIRAMKESATKLAEYADRKYVGSSIRDAANWNADLITQGQRFTYKIVNDKLQAMAEPATFYKNYLSLFEADSRLREEMDIGSLSTPMLSLPVTRTASGFQASLSLASYNEFDYKRTVDAATSRGGGAIGTMALGRIAEKYRLLLEEDTGKAKETFFKDSQIVSLNKLLANLGYEWQLESVNPRTNQYDIRLKKQGSSFLIGAASSGEKEILTYLFGIFALNVRDALILVDEPEMHLHPKWQATLLTVFEQLATETGNQFLLATHSPIFVSPASIQYVSRIYSENQRSKIIRLKNADLPEAKHLFAIVNSYNNEGLFFSDKVILVEGISDRLFFEAVLKKLGLTINPAPIFEIISVGGKGFFKAYERVLSACRVPYALIADLDYVSEVGPPELKSLFVVDEKGLKEDVIDNQGSKDGQSFAARMDEAMRTKNLDDLANLWSYIKGRRRKLKSQLTDAEQAALDGFIKLQRDRSVFILSKGDLETYLPDGYRSKDVDKLIRFLAGNFWDRLPQSRKDELIEIAGQLGRM